MPTQVITEPELSRTVHWTPNGTRMYNAGWLIPLRPLPDLAWGALLSLGPPERTQFLLGSSADAFLPLGALPGLAPRHAEISLERGRTEFFIRNLDPLGQTEFERDGNGWLPVSGKIKLVDGYRLRLGRGAGAVTFLFKALR